MTAQYYCLIDGRRIGPMEPAGLLEAGLTLDTPVWSPGQTGWLAARHVPELARLLGERTSCAITAVRQAPALALEDGGPIDVTIAWRPSGQFARGLLTPLRVGTLLYAAGLLLMLAAVVCFAVAVYFGNNVRQPRFDPQQQAIVDEHFPENKQRSNLFGFTSIGCVLLGPLLVMAGTAFFIVFIYRAWRALQDGETNMDPGLTVGLLFVPFFNFYWVFVGLAGLAGAANAFRRRHGLSGRAASTALGWGVGILFILACLPIVGWGPFLLFVLLLPVFLRSVLNALRATETPVGRDNLAPRRTWSTVTALLLAVVGMELLLFGAGGSIAVGRDYHQQRQQIDAAQAAISHLREKPNLPPDLRETLRTHEKEVARWAKADIPTSLQRMLTTFGAGVAILAIALLGGVLMGPERRRRTLARAS